MLMFAILYFALMIDSGLFDPAVRKILKMVKGDPLKVSVGTAYWPWWSPSTVTAPPPT
jgi:CitMHS family citrate-Mg2+:H+ or citrate-Ca2+:H+ symporter